MGSPPPLALFFQTPYQGEVSEDAPQGFSILKVSARDADAGSNGQITYSLHGPGAEKFRLDPHTGKNWIYQHRQKGWFLFFQRLLKIIFFCVRDDRPPSSSVCMATRLWSCWLGILGVPVKKKLPSYMVFTIVLCTQAPKVRMSFLHTAQKAEKFLQRNSFLLGWLGLEVVWLLNITIWKSFYEELFCISNLQK